MYFSDGFFTFSLWLAVIIFLNGITTCINWYFSWMLEIRDAIEGDETKEKSRYFSRYLIMNPHQFSFGRRQFNRSLTAEGNLFSRGKEEACNRTGCGWQITLANPQQSFSFTNTKKLPENFLHPSYLDNPSPHAQLPDKSFSDPGPQFHCSYKNEMNLASGKCWMRGDLMNLDHESHFQ